MLKKMNVVVVLAIFIFSMVPVALAEEVVGTTANGNKIRALPTGAVVGADGNVIKTADGNIVKKGAKLVDKTDLKELRDKSSALAKDLKAKVAAQKLTNKEAWVKWKANQKRLADQHKGIKDKYKLAKKDYQSSRDKLLASKKKVAACKKNENCIREKKNHRNNIQKHLVHLANVILKNLDKLQNRVEASDLDSTAQTDLLNRIKTQIADIKKAKTTLENKAEASDEEIKSAVTTIKKSWGKTKPLMKRGAGELVNAKLGNLIVRVNQLETKFKSIRDKLKEKGQDTTKLDASLKDFKAKMELAKKNWEAAKKKFAEAKTATDVNEAIKEAHSLQMKARDNIKDARIALREIMKEIKEEWKASKTEVKKVAAAKTSNSGNAVVIS